MTKVATVKELETALMRIVGKAIDDTGDDVANKIKASIDKEVYQSGKPDVYVRTYRLKDSVEVGRKKFNSNSNNVTLSVGHNTSILNYSSVNKQSGNSVSSNVPEIIQSGKAGAMRKKGYWKNMDWYIPQDHPFAVKRPYLEKVRKNLRDGEYRTLMIKNLKKQGLVVR